MLTNDTYIHARPSEHARVNLTIVSFQVGPIVGPHSRAKHVCLCTCLSSDSVRVSKAAEIFLRRTKTALKDAGSRRFRFGEYNIE